MPALIMPFPLYFDSEDFTSLKPAPSEENSRITEETKFSSANSGGYDADLVCSVWECAEVVPGNDPELWRKDEFGAWIHRLNYGRRNSEFGWEICDVNTGGNSDLLALRPMQWQNYIDQVAALTQSRVTACGIHNSRLAAA